MRFNLKNIAQYPVFFRLGIFILFLLLIWLPLAIPIYILLANNPNLANIITMGLLFIECLFLLHFWHKYIYNQSRFWQHYGLSFQRLNGIYLLNGLSIGLLFTFALFILEAILGLIEFHSHQILWGKLIFEGFLTGLGVGFAEEFFFRGWLLNELEKDYSQVISLWINTILFASLHFIKPWSEIIRTFPQFPGLILLGLILVQARRSHRNLLGISIGLHAGLVWGYYIINVGNLVQYSDKISPLITGVDGNPLAGVMGLLLLSFLLIIIRLK